MEYGYIILKKLYKTNKENTKFGREILKDSGIPYNMGLGILTELSNSGLIISLKGKTGGFYIAKSNITFLELFIALENNMKGQNYPFIDQEYKNKICNVGKIILCELEKTKI